MSEHTIKRPLSPHLQVYRPQMTTMLSILHRATGIALAVGTLMILWWLVAAADSPEAYGRAMEFSRSAFGIVLLAGWSFSVYFHMLNGVRHLVWDTGHLFEIGCATKAGYVIFYGSLVLTILTWVIVYV
jgi:succinate dehydrogenase / fumarate reductase cytochrome b subunit